jgi:DNA-binding transcriptional regulator/RsmH inhibitor MraZ
MPTPYNAPILTGVGHSHLDSRRRVTLPAKYRRAMLDGSEAEGLVLVPWYSHEVAIFTPEVWKRMSAAAEKPEELTALWDQAGALGAVATEVRVDSGGRFAFPAGLCSWMQAVPGSDRIELSAVGSHLLACPSRAAAIRKRPR